MKAVTVQDINKYIAIIRVNFENAYKTQNDEERQLLVKTWYAILKDYPKEVCDAAVLKAIKHSEFAPRVSTIVREIENMQEAQGKTDIELWTELTGVLYEVQRNYRAFSYGALDSNGRTQGDNARSMVAKIFNDLSPEIRAYCGSQRGLINISELDQERLNIEKGRFLKALPDIKQAQKRREETPAKLLGFLQLTGGEDEVSEE